MIDAPNLRRIIDAAENSEAMHAESYRQQPGGQAGRAENIAWGCVYLASDESHFVSGAEVVIDGALLAG